MWVEQPLLIVEDSSVAAGDRIVLHRVSLRIGSAGVYLLLGPNGAGKTSLLSALAGRSGYRLVGGRALFNGKPLGEMGLRDRALAGLVLGYQSPPPLRGVRVRELVREVERVYGPPEGAAGLARDVLGVERLLDRPVAGLSGGERKRLELFLVLLQRPRLALLDEPDSGVDVDTLSVLADVVAEAAHGGVSVLLASHTTGFIEKLVERDIIKSVFLVMDSAVAPLDRIEPQRLPLALRERGLHGLRALQGTAAR